MRAGAERRASRLILGAGAFFLFVLAIPLLTGRVFADDDLGRFHLPLRAFYHDSLASGDGFIWSPRLFAGFYAHGEGQAGMYHPLHLLLYSTLPLTAAFNLEFLISYPFMFAGMFCLLQRWALRRDAALFGAFLFTFSGFNLLHHMHMNAIAIVAHIPWCLWAIDRLLYPSDHRQAVRSGVVLAALTTSQLLLGYPQYVWFSVLIESIYVGFSVRTGTGWRTLASVAACKILGVVGGAVQLLPTWVALRDSIREDPTLLFRYSFSLGPLNLLQLVAPYSFQGRVLGGNTQEFGIYNGALATLTFAWLVVHRRALAERQRIVDWTIVIGMVGIVLALGDRGYLYRLQAHLPLVGGFRAPSRSILLFHFASAISAAIAFHTLSSSSASPGRSALRIWPLAAVAVISIIAAARFAGIPMWPGSSLAQYAAAPVRIAAGPLLILAGTACLAAGRRWGAPVAVVIVLLAVADHAVYGLRSAWSSPEDLQSFLEHGPPLPPDLTDRVLSGYNQMTMRGARLADGYVGLPPRHVLPTESVAFRRLAGVGWAIAPVTSPDDLAPSPSSPDQMAPSPRPVHYEWSAGAMPRAWLVSSVVPSRDAAEDIEPLDLAATAVVSNELQLPGGDPGDVRLTEDRPGRLSVITHSASRQVLIVSESYHSGWRAAIDRVPAAVIRADGDFLGCVVEPGQHAIEFTFDPPDLRLGKRLTIAALAIMLAGLIVSSRPLLRPGHSQASR